MSVFQLNLLRMVLVDSGLFGSHVCFTTVLLENINRPTSLGNTPASLCKIFWGLPEHALSCTWLVCWNLLSRQQMTDTGFPGEKYPIALGIVSQSVRLTDYTQGNGIFLARKPSVSRSNNLPPSGFWQFSRSHSTCTQVRSNHRFINLFVINTILNSIFFMHEDTMKFKIITAVLRGVGQ